MASELFIRRYRNWYAKLIRLYPKAHRERFGEGMEQTFNDLCRERAGVGKGLFAFVLWMFVETSAGIISENGRFIVMQNLTRRLIVWATIAALLLLVPLLARWNWPWFAYPVWGALLFGAELTFELIARLGGTAYRVATGIAVAAGLVLFWINAAVGIIGDGPVNLMYLGVLAVGFVGAFIARFEAHGMSRALFATALAQMLVPVIALVTWKAGRQDLLIDPNSPNPPFDPGIAPVFGLNAVFAMLFVGSALLFRRASPQGPK